MSVKTNRSRVVTPGELMAMDKRQREELSADQILDDWNARLIDARQNGATCIYLTLEDGINLWYADRTQRPLPCAVLEALKELTDAGYILVKGFSPSFGHVLQVYFRNAPGHDRVGIKELSDWGRAPTATE